MKGINKIFLVLCCFVGLNTISFGTTPFSNEGGPVITGRITGFKDGTKVFLSNLGEQKTYDSAVIVNNEFVLHGPLLDEPLVLFLDVGDGSTYTSMIIGNDKVRVEGDISDFPWNLRITGSKTEDENQLLKSLTTKLDNRKDELLGQYLKAPQDKKKVIWDSISQIDSTIRAIQVAFIKEYPNTYVSAVTLGSLRNKLPKEEVLSLFDLMNKEIKESKYGQIVQKFLETNVAKVGEAFTDFEAIDQKNKAMKLSDVKGKFKLLDFTASYCVPCRQSATELQELNQDYKNVLTIVSISADVSKKVWLESLERDKVTWLSLWDGKGTSGGAVLKYNASRLPTYVLIDKTGKIIDIWRGYSSGSIKRRLMKYKMAG